MRRREVVSSALARLDSARLGILSLGIFSFLTDFLTVGFFLTGALGTLIYAITLVTTPAPTVLTPSLIAKRCSFSRATGATNFTVKVAVSPGITISTPS